MANVIKMTKRCAVLAICGALSACGPSIEITSDTVSPRMVGKIPAGQHLGWVQTEVRTFTESADGKKTEVSGISCVIRSKDFTARVVSPARVKTPTYVQGARFADRGKPSPVVLKCQGGGLSGNTMVEAKPYGLSDSTTTTSYYYSNTGGYAGGISTTRHNSQLVSSFPWSYGGAIKLVLQ